MNRFVAEGLAAEAAEGKQVIYCGRLDDGRELCRAVHELIGPDLSGVRWTNGSEEVTTLNGGRVIVLSRPGALARWAPDIVFIDYSADQGPSSMEWFENAVVATSKTNGSVVRA